MVMQNIRLPSGNYNMMMSYYKRSYKIANEYMYLSVLKYLDQTEITMMICPRCAVQ